MSTNKNFQFELERLMAGFESLIRYEGWRQVKDLPVQIKIKDFIYTLYDLLLYLKELEEISEENQKEI